MTDQCVQEEETLEEVLRRSAQIPQTFPLPAQIPHPATRPTWNCLKEPPVVLWRKLGPVGQRHSEPLAGAEGTSPLHPSLTLPLTAGYYVSNTMAKGSFQGALYPLSPFYSLQPPQHFLSFYLMFSS